MPHSDLFIALALISVAIGGFASLVTTIKRRNTGIPESERIRLVSLLVLTLSATLFALLPLLIYAFGPDPDAAFRNAQLIMAAGLALLLGVRWIPSLQSARTSRTNRWFFAMSVSMLVCAILLQAISAAQVGMLPITGSYLTGVVIIVVLRSINFFRLVIQNPDT